MTENNPFNEQLFQEATALARLVELAARARKYGTVSERNPTLGKMVSCPHCGRRKRSNDPVSCCSATYRPGTENDKVHIKARKNPRLTRNKPPLFEVHARLVELEKDPDFKEYEGISGVVEAAIVRRKKVKAKKHRDRQKKSRKLNRRK